MLVSEQEQPSPAHLSGPTLVHDLPSDLADCDARRSGLLAEKEARLTLQIVAILSIFHLICAPSSFSLRPTEFDPITLWTSQLVHKDFMHLLSNSIGIAIGGLWFERHYSFWTYLFFIFAATGLSSTCELLYQPDYTGQILGASGLCCALAGTLARTCRSPISIPIHVILLAVLVFQAWDQTVPNIAYFSHLGGYLFGLAWAILVPGRKRHATRSETEEVPGVL